MTKTKKWLAIAGVGMAVMMLVAAALPAAIRRHLRSDATQEYIQAAGANR